MTAIDISAEEAGALAHALQMQVRYLDTLLDENTTWPAERRNMVALFSRLRRVALPLIDDDLDACREVYADDAEFF